MSDLLKLVGRLHAYRLGKAVRSETHAQVTIESDALVVAPLAMAGEDTSIHALAIGRVGTQPEIRVIPDPRNRDDQYDLVEWLGERLETYFQECRDAGRHPQIWASSGAAAGQLDILADRLRFTRDAPKIKRTGELLTYATERMPCDGQLALMTATGALAAHFSTGQQEGEDEHLGVFLTWLDPPPGVPIARAVEQAERQVMGVKTDPEFDRNELQPLLSAYNAARKNGASAAELKRRATAIENRLAPIVTAIYTAIQQALGYLEDFPPAGILSELTEREQEEFASFMEARDRDIPLPYRDKPKAGAFKLAARELAASQLRAGQPYGDDMALARGRVDGSIVTGVLRNHRADKVRPRLTVHRFEIESSQTNLHLRSGDEVALMSDTRLRCVVEGVNRVDSVTLVALRVIKGMNKPGVPAEGTEIDLAPPPPDWNHIWLERKQMGKRLSITPWTHEAGVPPVAMPPNVTQPNDLVAAIERLK